MTNILALKNVKQMYRITFYSQKENSFIVHKPDTQVIFTEHPSRLYVHDVKNRNMVFMMTVNLKKSQYSDRQNWRAVVATKVYAKIGCPSIKDFKFLVTNQLINNCPVTLEDIKIAEDVYGKNINALKGKTTK